MSESDIYYYPFFNSKVPFPVFEMFMFWCLICQVEDLSKEPQVERELMLVKLNADSSTKGEVWRSFSPSLIFTKDSQTLS